ncbi:MAG: hypothetical protein DHS20C08_16330 [Rhodomicrobium sp.]|nr:MAG: hypothetical protein DHS20C08_16330 [Rhodomicrobium sp.]
MPINLVWGSQIDPAIKGMTGSEIWLGLTVMSLAVTNGDHNKLFWIGKLAGPFNGQL